MSFNSEKDLDGNDISDITLSKISLNNPANNAKIKYDTTTSSWVAVSASQADNTFWSYKGGTPAEPYSAYSGLNSLSKFAYSSGYMSNYTTGTSIGSLAYHSSFLVSGSQGWYTAFKFPNITSGNYLVESQIVHSTGSNNNAIFRMYVSGNPAGYTSGYISNKALVNCRGYHSSCIMRSTTYLTSNTAVHFFMVDGSVDSGDGKSNSSSLRQTYVKVTQI